MSQSGTIRVYTLQADQWQLRSSSHRHWPVPAASRVPAAAERGAIRPLRLHRRQQRVDVLQAAAAASWEVVRGVGQEGQLAKGAPAEAVCRTRHLQQAPAAKLGAAGGWRGSAGRWAQCSAYMQAPHQQHENMTTQRPAFLRWPPPNIANVTRPTTPEVLRLQRLSLLLHAAAVVRAHLLW